MARQRATGKQYGIGQAVLRTEDPRLLMGRGRFTDDLTLPRQTYAHVLRSPHANADIRSIDVSAAFAAPGVLTVLTGADAEADGLGAFVAEDGLANRDGSAPFSPPHPMLARDRVLYVGQPVAFVVAESLPQALDAAELIRIDYEALPSVTDTAGALLPAAPRLWPDAPGNIALDWEEGDAAATQAAFAAAAHIASVELLNNRVVGAPLEPIVALGEFDPARERYTLYAPSQGVHNFRHLLARMILRIPESALRFVTLDMGGGFGVREMPKAEYVLVLWAARRLGRPVRWTGERSDTMVSDHHARDHVTHAQLALDRDGTFLAVRVDTTANIGAFASVNGRTVPTDGYASTMTSVYTTPAYYVTVKCVFTNTVQTDAYRGAGRPEGIYVMERLVDVAAADLGLTPIELRRRNLIPVAAMPYRTPSGELYDSGDFAAAMEDALELAAAADIEARKTEARRQGKRHGLGLSTYVKINGGTPNELVEIRFEVGGEVVVLIGSQSNGQGHETAYAQIVYEHLGVPFERIRVVQGDSDLIPYGKGTGGSSAITVGGSAIVDAAHKIIASGMRIAGHLLEAAEADIEFGDGRFTVVGTDRSLRIMEVADAAFRPGPATVEFGFGLAERALYLPRAKTYPNGCHLCEVEVDVETGEVEIVRYLVVDDLGVVLNPLLAEAQIHGGVVQGIGQALVENFTYDPDSGQLLTGSFMDYCMPRAHHLPAFTVAFNEIPCPTNPLGVKGAGEAGTTGAPPALVNAVVDALSEYGIRHIDMPVTPERIWHAIRDARAN